MATLQQQVRQTKRGQIAFSANNTVELENGIARGAILRRIALRLKGAPTLLAANNTTAKTKLGDEWACVKKIELVANDTEVIRSISGRDLFWMNYFLYGATPKINALIGDGATANVAFDSTLYLPVWAEWLPRPFVGALDTRKLSRLDLRITWGASTDMNADAAAWTTAPTIDVSVLESFGIGEDVTFMQSYITPSEFSPTGSADEYPMPLLPNYLYAGIFVNTYVTAADDAAVIDSLQVVSGGSTLWPATSFESQRQIEVLNGHLPTLPTRRSSSSDGTAWMYLNFVTDPSANNEGVDAIGLSEIRLQAKVLKAGTIRIYPVRQRPAALQAALKK